MINRTAHKGVCSPITGTFFTDELGCISCKMTGGLDVNCVMPLYLSFVRFNFFVPLTLKFLLSYYISANYLLYSCDLKE